MEEDGVEVRGKAVLVWCRARKWRGILVRGKRIEGKDVATARGAG
jgi:hypothetical protein